MIYVLTAIIGFIIGLLVFAIILIFSSSGRLILGKESEDAPITYFIDWNQQPNKVIKKNFIIIQVDHHIVIPRK